METYQIQVENLKCNGCANTIIKKLSEIDGVKQVSVDLEQALVKVQASTGQREQLVRKLSDLGYPEAGSGNLFHTGVSFLSCAIGKWS